MKEPRIVVVEDGINALGLSMRTTQKTVFADLPKIYAKYKELKDNGKIPNMKEPWEYISLSDNYSENASWEYHTGHVVTGYMNDEGQNADGLTRFSVPGGTYAVFELRCKTKLTFILTMARMKKYIYAKWLPASGYSFSGVDYEYNSEGMSRESPYHVDLYVGIVRA